MEDYVVIPFNDTASLVYSIDAAGVDNKPPTSLRLEYKPCSNQYQQSWGPEITYYPTEMNTGTCEYDEQVDATFDPRFIPTGLVTNEYDIQRDNGVLDIIQDEPNVLLTIPNIKSKQDSIYTAWTRPTIDWFLSCEVDGFDRQSGYELLVN